MKECCEGKTDELLLLREKQGRVLKIVLCINAAMFLIEASAGLIAKSSALLADSLDMFGDAAVYALSLYVIDRGPIWRGRAAFIKGVVMALFGLGVLVDVATKLLSDVTPRAELMGVFGLLALLANVTCLSLLYRHRSDDINMSSTWLCSRNDIIANTGVLLAAGAVALLGAGWPDIVVGLIIAVLFLKGAFSILRDSSTQLRAMQAS